MKKIMTLLLTNLLIFCVFAQNNQESEKEQLLKKVRDKKYSEFLEIFPDITLPFNTKKLNNDGYNSKFAQIKSELSLKFIFYNIPENQKYYYSYVDQETQKSTEGFKNYDIRAIFKFVYSDCFFICYSKFDQEDALYILNSYDIDGILKDSLIINNKQGETEYFLYKASYINKDVNVASYTYDVNPDIYDNKKSKDKTLPKSRITTENFIFNVQTGKFEKKDNQLS